MLLLSVPPVVLVLVSDDKTHARQMMLRISNRHGNMLRNKMISQKLVRCPRHFVPPSRFLLPLPFPFPSSASASSLPLLARLKIVFSGPSSQAKLCSLARSDGLQSLQAPEYHGRPSLLKDRLGKLCDIFCTVLFLPI